VKRIIFGFAYLEVDRGDGRAPKIINARVTTDPEMLERAEDPVGVVTGAFRRTLKRKFEALDA
jgi:hypothetical protein